MTLYNRYGTQLSIPEKPKPLILLFPKNQIPKNLNPSKYIYGVSNFYKKIDRVKKRYPYLNTHSWEGSLLEGSLVWLKER